MSERTIRMTAKSLAEAFWDEKRGESPRFLAFWPDVKQFVMRNWPTFYPMAKEILVGQLNDKLTSEPVKEAIMKALVEDFEKGRGAKGVKPGYSTTTFLNPDHPGRVERKIFHED